MGVCSTAGPEEVTVTRSFLLIPQIQRERPPTQIMAKSSQALFVSMGAGSCLSLGWGSRDQRWAGFLSHLCRAKLQGRGFCMQAPSGNI